MIASEGYSTVFTILLFSVLAGWGASFLNPLAAIPVYIVLMILCLLTLWFFRDPDRQSPDDPDLVLAPADGAVVLVRETEEESYLGNRATQISIFLSPLDVHVNRVPANGKLEYLEYFPGKYLVAWADHASELNERAHFGIRHPGGVKILFKQITGFLARRIVYHIKEGDDLKAGDRFGIMKFGSRMDVIVPGEVEVLVKEGDRTVAGKSVLGRIRS